ncbi:MAG: YbaY family lipoprotein [Deltaproteobacteria bacterium]
MLRNSIAGVVIALSIFGAVGRTATASPPRERDPGPAAQILSGTVSLGKTPYNERMALPGMAVVHVELLDISVKDTRTAILGGETIWLAGSKLPVDFRIAYDPSRIDPTHKYIVRARIMEGEKVLFLNTTPYYVLTKGSPGKVDIVVVPAQVHVR